MRSENPAALRFILQDDIYLLQSEKVNIPLKSVIPIVDVTPETVVETPVEAKAPVVAEPVTPAPHVAVTETSPVQFNYMGGNKKQFLIITHYPAEDFIAADHLAALQNILRRKDYDMDDVAILNIAKATVTAITDLVNYFKPEKLLILGETAMPSGMGMPPLNQPKKMKNGVLLHSFSFDEMMSSTDNKKAFWDQMKNL